MKQVRAVLVKPLDGKKPGDERVFDQVDYDRLVAQNAVKKAANQDNLDEDTAEAKAARARENGWVSVEEHDAVVAERDRLRADLDAATKSKSAGRSK